MMRWRLATVGLAIALTGCTTTTLEPPAELVDFEQQARFKEVWDYSLSDKGEDLLLGLRPAYDGSRIYAADHAGNVIAVDATTGKEAWRVETAEGLLFGKAGLAFAAGPTVAEGRVAVGSLDGDILVLDADDGSRVWRKKVDADLLSAPVIDSGKLLVRTGDSRLVAFDLETGNILWDTSRDMPLLSLRGQSQPVVRDGNVYIAWDNGKVASISLATGVPEWETAVGQPVGSTEVEEIADIDGDLAIFGSEVYVAGHNTALAALAIESGEILWRDEISAVHGPAVSYGSVVVTDINSVIRAYDRLAGTKLWTQEIIRARYVTAPALWNDFVVVGDFEGYIHFFDRTTGKMQARFRHGGEPVNTRPLPVSDELLVVLSADGELAAYRQVGRKGGGKD